MKSRIIAIYDNDTAGQFAKLKLLDDVKIPDNIKILNYLDMNCFNKYPTFSPNKEIIFDNINGRACSIELFLPDECIKDDNGFYYIEWQSLQSLNLSSGLKKEYQGVISKKEIVKKDAFDLIRSIISNKTPFNPEAWDKLRALLETIVYAFK